MNPDKNLSDAASPELKQNTTEESGPSEIPALSPPPQPVSLNPLPAPVATAQAGPPTLGVDHPEHSPALEVVLQWLTYVFWFWTLCVISIVLSGALSYFIVDNGNDSQWIAYMLAPLFILMPAAIVTDHYYKKIEPPKKHGFAAVVMVINAVVACIFAVGSLIAAGVAFTSVLIDSGATEGKTVTIIASSVVAVMSLLFFLRIIYISKLNFIHKKFGIIMSGVVVITLILAIAGPLTGEIKRKTDRLIENNYYSIKYGVDNHVRDNKTLPNSLSDVGYEGDAAAAVATGRITYVKGSEESLNTTSYGQRASKNLKYEICVDWQYKKGSVSSYDYESDRYYGGSHKSGEQCYDESAYVY